MTSHQLKQKILISGMEASAHYIAKKGYAKLVNNILANYGYKSIKRIPNGIPDCQLVGIYDEIHAVEVYLRAG